jgi:hypothetical protein
MLFGDGTHADILAFTHDATVKMVAASRSPDIKAEAQRRVATAESGSAVWFKHMRKAGGSSVRAALEEAFYTQKKRAGARSAAHRNDTGLHRRSREQRRRDNSEPVLAGAWGPLPGRDAADDDNRREDDAVTLGMSQDFEVVADGRRRLVGHLGNSSYATERGQKEEAMRRRLERSYEHKLEKALAQTGGNENGFTLHHQEFDLFPVKCLILEPRTVYITAIREPVNRFISLFYYDGIRYFEIGLFFKKSLY